MKKSEKKVSAILVTVILILISVLTMMASVSVGAAATYYVTPTGDDSNTGKIDPPWRTIQHAAETVAAGDTVYYIMAGTGIDVKDGSSN